MEILRYAQNDRNHKYEKRCLSGDSRPYKKTDFASGLQTILVIEEKRSFLELQFREALYNLVEVCRILAVLLWPFLPGTAAKIYAQLGLESAPDKFSAARWGELPPGHAIGTPAPLFPRKDA